MIKFNDVLGTEIMYFEILVYKLCMLVPHWAWKIQSLTFIFLGAVARSAHIWTVFLPALAHRFPDVMFSLEYSCCFPCSIWTHTEVVWPLLTYSEANLFSECCICLRKQHREFLGFFFSSLYFSLEVCFSKKPPLSNYSCLVHLS